MTKSVEVEVEVIAVTEFAIMVDSGMNVQAWVPRIYIESGNADDCVEGDELTISIPEWLATKRRLV